MKIKTTLVALTCGAVALSAAVVTSAKTESKPQPVQVNLYLQPESSSQVLESVKPNQNLIPIYRKGEWIKVGNPRDGKVGWINQKQYRKAYAAWYRPNVQTIFVRNDQDKEGKPVVNIVAYSNGKKLDEKQAKALYERMQKEQKHEMKAMRHFNQQMSHFFDRETMMFKRDFPGFMHSDFAPPMMLRPIIVVNQPPAHLKKVEKSSVKKGD